MTLTNRILPLEGVENFRDFGGYVAAEGRHMRPGRFWRAAHQGKATAADVAAIDQLGLTTVVDLRRPMERIQSPPGAPKAFRARSSNATWVTGPRRLMWPSCGTPI